MQQQRLVTHGVEGELNTANKNAVAHQGVIRSKFDPSKHGGHHSQK